MPEIRVPVSEKLDSIIKSKSDELGVKKTEFIKSIILSELLNGLKGKEVQNQNEQV